MYFRVYEHYDDNQPNYDTINKPDECFICYELRTDLEISPISLKSQINYNKSCGCDGWIHKQCLDIWYKKQKKCPICRLEIWERPVVACAVVNVVPYSNRIYIFICKSFYKMATIFAYCFLVYSAIEFYLSVIMTKHISRDNYENHSNIPFTSSELNDSEFIENLIAK